MKCSAPYVAGILRDTITLSSAFIDSPHLAIHQGKHYTVSDPVTLSIGVSREIRIDPNGAYPHMLFQFISGGLIQVYFYEDTTKTAGTSITPRNNNRVSVNVSTSAFSHTPGGAGDGTLIWSLFLGSSIAGGQAGLLRSDNEWILNPAKIYLLRVTSQVNNNPISILASYYEV